MRIIVDRTGPFHSTTPETKWYAQVQLTSHDMLPLGVKSYSFGATPTEALENFISVLTSNGVAVE
jgi:hypothetical protein